MHPVGSALFSGLDRIERLDDQLHDTVGLKRRQRDQLRRGCYDYPECRMIDEVHGIGEACLQLTYTELVRQLP